MNPLPSRPYVELAVGSLLGFVLMTSLVITGVTAGMDDAAYRFGEAWDFGAVGTAAYVATQFGYSQGLVPLAVIAGIILLAYGWRWRSLLPLVVLGVAEGANQWLKLLIHRERPMGASPAMYVTPLDHYSFPSGHAMDSMALYSLLLVWVLVSDIRPLWKVPLATLLLVAPLAIGLSRVVLGVHWLSDVIAGWLAGLLVMSLVVLMWRQVEGTTRPRQP